VLFALACQYLSKQDQISSLDHVIGYQTRKMKKKNYEKFGIK
jgi:hypothetical protein